MLATNGTVDVVVSDVRMPQNGHKLAAHVARLLPPIPIVFMSGFDPRLRELEGFGPLLKKPFSRSELLNTIREVVARTT
jgi:CheY-like chemotaxis protein